MLQVEGNLRQLVLFHRLRPQTPITVPLPSATAQADDDVTSSGTAAVSPAVADDADLIEKEWVEKAKDIVAKTKNDPHMQSVELTNFRHDYMKKRYGKEIKLPLVIKRRNYELRTFRSLAHYCFDHIFVGSLSVIGERVNCLERRKTMSVA